MHALELKCGSCVLDCTMSFEQCEMNGTTAAMGLYVEDEGVRGFTIQNDC